MNTPSAENILGYYESIGRVSRSMALAAREQDWDTVSAAEGLCATLIAQLSSIGNPAALLSGSGRARRMAILRGILDDDAEIRSIAQPSLAKIDRWLAPKGAPPCRQG